MYNTIALNTEITHRKGIDAVIGVLFFVLATALGAYVRIPVPGSPVPITLQTFFVVLSGAVLGKRLGVISQAAYIFLGALGLPIFQGYAFGTAHILGPTGGYLIGFLAASFLVGKMLQKDSNTYATLLAFIAGNMVLYALGVTWLVSLYRISFIDAVRIGVLPFLAVEAVKILAAAFIYRVIADRSRSIFS